MDMKIREVFAPIREALHRTLGFQYADKGFGIKRGEVFMTLQDAATGMVQERRHLKNLIVKDASILVARVIRDNAETGLRGAVCLAVGIGDDGWNPLSPPAPTTGQRALFGEICRKTFTQAQFIAGDGSVSSVPTNVVDFTTTFSESEAVGPLVEMGIIGGNISTDMLIRNPVPAGAYDPTVDLTQYETLINYLTFPIISKPATSTFSLTWRLTF